MSTRHDRKPSLADDCAGDTACLVSRAAAPDASLRSPPSAAEEIAALVAAAYALVVDANSTAPAASLWRSNPRGMRH